ncbi:GGDEF domain-containing protein [Fusibacter paucivorans]|uniref:GGDEF domain-containing protein n=1 Tax=Fusibacter paucivorans TaxID=76009 RepID=A0ABS5PMR5_9FIRM|nr:GGDEF domain-containing protein [Fusibacter paucivorans]MBS7525651.1 GGDEF domain-containing protein [Fusibacter paucivorans]
MNSLTSFESRFVIDEINLYITVIAGDHTISFANKQLLNFSGVHFENINHLPYWELPWWQNGMANQNQLMFAVERAFFGETVRFDATYTKYDNTLHEIDFLLKPLYKRDEIVSVIAMGYNISDLVKTQKALTRRERQLDAFFEFSSDGYFFFLLDQPIEITRTDDAFIHELMSHQKLTFFNQQFEKILNQELSHQTVIETLFPNVKDLSVFWRDMILNGKAQFDTTIQLEETYYDEEALNTFILDEPYDCLYIRVTLVAIFDDQGAFEGNYAVVRERTQEVRNIKRLEFLANKDPLTKINNRRSFYEKAVEKIEVCQNDQMDTSVVMIDIDFFKRINDTFGHDAGDTVLYHFATLIESFVGERGIVARYGGEEFVLLLMCPFDEAKTFMEALRIKISEMIVRHDDDQITLTASIGIRGNTRQTDNIDTLTAEADKALYYAKNHGRNRVAVYADLPEEAKHER